MKSSNEKKNVDVDTALTYERVVALGALDHDPRVKAALATCAEAGRIQAEADAALEDVRQATGSTDRRARRVAQESLDERRRAVDAARDAVEDAGRALAGARRDAFGRVAPIIRAEHARRLPQFEAALDALITAAQQVQEIERVAHAYARPSGASIAPSTPAIGAAFADALLFQLAHWKGVIARLRRASAA
jgi:hypothetical protein